MLVCMILLSVVILTSIASMMLTINPVNAVMFLIAVFICSAISFILLNMDFIGFIFLMVYVGAITVLFLFIVMIINIRKIEYDNTTYLVVGGIIMLIFSIQVVYIYVNKIAPSSLMYMNLVDNNSFFIDTAVKDHMNRHQLIYSLGILLFNNYYILIIYAAIILLVSIIGAILLTSTKNGLRARTQYNQIVKNSNIINLLII